MIRGGKILVNNLKTLITGSSNRVGNSIVEHIVKKGGTVYTVDQRVWSNQTRDNLHFQQGDLGDERFFQDYLKKIEPIDALINCAGFRRSYGYHLGYLITKNVYEKMRENRINKFGCRGVIINVVYMNSEYTQQYFDEQKEFLDKYGIDDETIDDQVYLLADDLTVARIRLNTVLVHSKVDSTTFSKLLTHIVEDQYVAGQVINLDDDLHKSKVTMNEIQANYVHVEPKRSGPEEKYLPPPDHKPRAQIGSNKNKQLKLPPSKS